MRTSPHRNLVGYPRCLPGPYGTPGNHQRARVEALSVLKVRHRRLAEAGEYILHPLPLLNRRPISLGPANIDLSYLAISLLLQLVLKRFPLPKK